MTWEVTATFRGKRIRTEMKFTSRAKAQAYADETKKYYPNSNPRLVNTSKKRS